MNKKERHATILQLLQQCGKVEVSYLSDYFQTSQLTIRKDLNELNDRGQLQRCYGGAKSLLTIELPINERLKRYLIQKKQIGKLAAGLVRDGDSIFIDGGTTTEQIVENLVHLSGLVVITNSINIVNKLMNIGNINIYVPEGKIDQRGASIVGSLAEHALEKYNARIAFIGIDGITKNQGLLNNSFEANSLSKILLKNSQIKVVLADSSKFDAIGSVKLCNLSDIDVLITDSNIPQTYIDYCQEQHIQLIISES